MPENREDCSLNCATEVDKPEFADEFWHHPECPNHTTTCCPINEQEDIPECKCVFVTPVCKDRIGHIRRMMTDNRLDNGDSNV